MAVEPVDRLAALLGQFITAVGQQPQHRRLPVGDDLAQVPARCGDLGDAQRVEPVRLAAVTGAQQADLRRQGGRHVHDRLAGSDELLRQQPSEPVAALDRPAPGRPCGGPAEQRPGHRRGGDHLEFAELLPVLVDRDRRVGALVWIDADGDQRCLLCLVHAGHGEQPEFRDDQASIELRRVRARPAGRLCESHTVLGGQEAGSLPAVPCGHPTTNRGEARCGHPNKSEAWHRLRYRTSRAGPGID